METEMIHSLSEEIQKSYIGISIDFIPSTELISSLECSVGEEDVIELIDNMNLPWVEETVNIITKSLFKHD